MWCRVRRQPELSCPAPRAMGLDGTHRHIIILIGDAGVVVAGGDAFAGPHARDPGEIGSRVGGSAQRRAELTTVDPVPARLAYDHGLIVHRVIGVAADRLASPGTRAGHSVEPCGGGARVTRRRCLLRAPPRAAFLRDDESLVVAGRRTVVADRDAATGAG